MIIFLRFAKVSLLIHRMRKIRSLFDKFCIFPLFFNLTLTETVYLKYESLAIFKLKKIIRQITD